MTKHLTSKLQLLFGFILIIGMGFGLYFLVKNLLIGFLHLQKEIAAVIIAAFAAFIISIVSLIISKYYERKSDLIRELRNKKIHIL
jgi:uncharacterized membrane protein